MQPDITSHAYESSAQQRPLPRALSWTQQDFWVAAGLFFLGVLTRVPFTGQVLYHWDSVNFAFSLQQFDIANGQPHIPGYILYVYLARAVNLIFADAQTTLAAISAISSGLALVFLYKLGADLFSRPVGLVAAIFLGTSPLFWFYGEVALPHALDALVVIVLVWVLYRVAQGEARWAVPAAIWLGLAGGFRPQTQIFLAPLAVYAAWHLPWRKALAALLVLVAVDLAWFLPLVASAGGLSVYLEIMEGYSAEFNTTTTIFSGGLWGLMRNLRKLGMYTLYGWGLAAIPAALAIFQWLRARGLRSIGSQGLRRQTIQSLFYRPVRFWFFVYWIGPTLAFYVLIHMGQQGLVFVFLPALMLLSAAAVEYLGWRSIVWGRWAVAGLVAAGGLIFLFAPTFPLEDDRVKLLTVDTLRRHDETYLPRIQELPEHFAPENTLLLTTEWRFPNYYLPEYTLAPYAVGARWEVEQGGLDVNEDNWLNASSLGLQPNPQGELYLVILDNVLLPYNSSPGRQEELTFSNGQTLTYLRFTPQEWIYLGTQSFAVMASKSPAP